MIRDSVISAPQAAEPMQATGDSAWAFRALLLWRQRRSIARVAAISLIAGLAIAFAIPKRYKSVARIMPPDQRSSSAMMLAAMGAASGNLGALGAIAGGLLNGHSSSDLFVDLLRSATVSSHIVDRFNLQTVYHKRYRVDAAKHLEKCTSIIQDRKTGVIMIEVEDTDRTRARDIAKSYLDELNEIVTRTNTSAAHRERVFIEQRLQTVGADLEEAELQLSNFSTNNRAVDIREQTHAMVDAGARLEAELLVERSGLESLRQVYGASNIRVRESEARIGSLQAELQSLAGPSRTPRGDATSDPPPDSSHDSGRGLLYPALRQIPQLAVPYADFTRRVKVQEALFELLNQQYEMARIEEAKDVPVVSVIDSPGIPEKKSFPPRLLLAILLSMLAVASYAILIIARNRWNAMSPDDVRKTLMAEIAAVFRRRLPWIKARGGLA